MLVRELITKAYYLSNKVGREFETVSGSEISDGLDILNSIITQKNNATGVDIPSYTHGTFVGVPGQEKYTIDLIFIETLTFLIDTVRYSLIRKDRWEYFSYSRTNNVNSLPYQYYFERVNGDQGDIYMYFPPERDYTFEYVGKARLTAKSLDQELNDSLDDYYQTYLQFELAFRIATYFSIPFDAQKMQQLKEMRHGIVNINQPNRRVIKTTPFTQRERVNYGYANLGGGWQP